MPRSKLTAKELVLALLCKDGSKTFGEIMDFTGYSKATVSEALKFLQKQGCVEYIDGKYYAKEQCCKDLFEKLRVLRLLTTG